MRDRQTMARRVRGYVTLSKSDAYSGSNAPGQATSSERKALATMGRRGGKKAEERWKTDPEGEYVQVRRTALEETNIKRATEGRATARQIANYFDDTLLQTGKYPSIPDTMREFGVSRPTVKRALPTVKRALKNA